MMRSRVKYLLNTFQDIAAEVEHLKSEIWNFLNNSNDDSVHIVHKSVTNKILGDEAKLTLKELFA